MPARGPPSKIPAFIDPRPEWRIGTQNLEGQVPPRARLVTEAQADAATAGAAVQAALDERREVADDTQGVVNDITREFKVQQNAARRKIDELQAYVAELERELSETQMRIRKTRDSFERQRHQREEIIQRNIVKCDQMAAEFRDMLKGTLLKMSDRIEMAREADGASAPA